MTKATEATKIVRPQQVRKIKATPLSTFGLDLDRAVLGGLMAAERFPLEAVSLHAGNFSPDLYPLAKAVLSVGRRVGVCDPVAVAEELSRGGCGIDTVSCLVTGLRVTGLRVTGLRVTGLLVAGLLVTGPLLTGLRVAIAVFVQVGSGIIVVGIILGGVFQVFFVELAFPGIGQVRLAVNIASGRRHRGTMQVHDEQRSAHDLSRTGTNRHAGDFVIGKGNQAEFTVAQRQSLTGQFDQLADRNFAGACLTTPMLDFGVYQAAIHPLCPGRGAALGLRPSIARRGPTGRHS